jgi:YggT family protein
MFIASNFIEALASALDAFLGIYLWVIIIRSLISWVSPDPFNPIVQMLQRVTDPILYPIQRAIGGYFGGIDFSPIIAIIGIQFLKSFLVRSLFQFAAQLG